MEIEAATTTCLTCSAGQARYDDDRVSPGSVSSEFTVPALADVRVGDGYHVRVRRQLHPRADPIMLGCQVSTSLLLVAVEADRVALATLLRPKHRDRSELAVVND